MDSNAYRWYVIQSNPRKESFVVERIEEMGREVFLPLIPHRPATRRTLRRRTPMFPGYLFARLSTERGDIARVQWGPGVRRILGTGSRPTPVDDAAVAAIRRHARRQGASAARRRLRAGQKVKILDGPLAGLIAVIECPSRSARERVCLLLDMFRRTTRVQMSAHVALAPV